MKKRFLALLLVLALLCSACSFGSRRGRGDTSLEGQYGVYFLTAPDEIPGNGAVLGREFRELPADAGAVEELVRFLLSGPGDPDLVSPFPQGTALRGWRLEEGLVTVDLSEAYGGLSGVNLSLADACIVLTLCQLERVDRVYLTVEGRPRPFRDQVLAPGDFLLEVDPVVEETAPPAQAAANDLALEPGEEAATG